MSAAGISLLPLLVLLMVEQTTARGVLSIKLLSFENPKGRTYEGQCCDPNPLDGAVCHDKCDYVMRLIIAGLGRANDHVFLFHRPLKYDSNDLHFQEHGGGDLTLTVLFDQWPAEGHVKMNAFFYDYDDFDHTTELVDWFETELSSDGSAWQGHTDLAVSGNRQQDKTRLVFQWSRHCAGGLDDDKECLPPPAEWTFWSGDSSADTQTGFQSADLVSSERYQDNAEEIVGHGLMKSPFRPFSTRKNDLDLHQSSSPRVADDDHIMFTQRPVFRQEYGVRSEFDRTNQRQSQYKDHHVRMSNERQQQAWSQHREGSVFIEDPQRRQKEGKLKHDEDRLNSLSQPVKYSDKKLQRDNAPNDAEESSKYISTDAEKSPDNGPSTVNILDHSRPRHGTIMTPPEVDKNQKVFIPKEEEPDTPRFGRPPASVEDTTTGIVQGTERHRDLEQNGLRGNTVVDTTAEQKTENRNQGDFEQRTKQENSPQHDSGLVKSTDGQTEGKSHHGSPFKARPTKKSEEFQRSTTGVDTVTKNSAGAVTVPDSNRLKTTNAENSLKPQKKSVTQQSDSVSHTDKDNGSNDERDHAQHTDTDHNVKQTYSPAVSSGRSSISSGHSSTPQTPTDTTKTTGKADRSKQKNGVNSEKNKFTGELPADVLQDPRLKNKEATEETATTSDSPSTVTSISTTTARPEGWGPLHKNRFVTWLPATPASVWVPVQIAAPWAQSEVRENKNLDNSPPIVPPLHVPNQRFEDADVYVPHVQVDFQYSQPRIDRNKHEPVHHVFNHRHTGINNQETRSKADSRSHEQSDTPLKSDIDDSKHGSDQKESDSMKSVKRVRLISRKGHRQQTPLSDANPNTDGHPRKLEHDKNVPKNVNSEKKMQFPIQEISHDKKSVQNEKQSSAQNHQNGNHHNEQEKSGHKAADTGISKESEKTVDRNPLLLYKQQQEWLKKKKAERLRSDFSEISRKGEELRKPASVPSVVSVEHDGASDSKHKEFAPALSILEEQESDNQKNDRAKIIDATSTAGPATTHASTDKETSREDATLSKGLKENQNKDGPTTKSHILQDDSLLAKDEQQRLTTASSSEKSSVVFTRGDRHKATEQEHEVSATASFTANSKHDKSTSAPKEKDEQRPIDTERHSSLKPSNIILTSTSTERTTADSGIRSNPDRTSSSKHLGKMESTTLPTTTTEHEDSVFDIDTGVTRAESMKRVKTQTFQTPTKIMWYVTTHPAYVKTNQRFSLQELEENIEDTNRNSVNISPEEKYNFPTDRNLPDRPEILVQRVEKQEKNEEKKRRRYNPGMLKSRLDIIPSLTGPTITRETNITTDNRPNTATIRKSPFGLSDRGNSVTYAFSSTDRDAKNIHSVREQLLTSLLDGHYQGKTKNNRFQSVEAYATKSSVEPDTNSPRSLVETITATVHNEINSPRPAETIDETSNLKEQQISSFIMEKARPSTHTLLSPDKTNSGPSATSTDDRIVDTERDKSSKGLSVLDQETTGEQNEVNKIDHLVEGNTNDRTLLLPPNERAQPPLTKTEWTKLSAEETDLRTPSEGATEAVDSKLKEVHSQEAVHQTPALRGWDQSSARRRDKLREVMNKLRQRAPSDLSGKNPFLNKNTWVQETLTPRKSEGRVSALYTSSVNGTKINASRVSEDRLIGHPLLETGSKGGGKYVEGGEKRSPGMTITDTYLQPSVKIRPDKADILASSNVSNSKAQSLLDSTLRMLKDSERRQGEKSRNGTQTFSQHPISLESAIATLKPTSHSNVSPTSSNGKDGNGRTANVVDSSTKGPSPLSTKSSVLTTTSAQLESTTVRGYTVRGFKTGVVTTISTTTLNDGKSLSSDSSSSLMKSSGHHTYNTIPEQQQTTIPFRNATMTSPQTVHSMKSGEPSVNSVAGKSPPTRTKQDHYTLSIGDGNDSDSRSSKTKLSTSDGPHPFSLAYVSPKSTESTEGDRHITLMTVRRTSSTNTPANASHGSPARGRGAESKRPSVDLEASINRPRDLSSSVHPHDANHTSYTTSASSNRSHATHVLLTRPGDTLNPAPSAVEARDIISKHSTTLSSGWESVPGQTGSKSNLFTETTRTYSESRTSVNLISSTSDFSASDKSQGHTKDQNADTTTTTVDQSRSTTSSGIKTTTTAPSTKASTTTSPVVLSTTSQISSTGYKLKDLKDEVVTKTEIATSPVNRRNQKTPESLQRDSLVSLFNGLANIISGSIATVKNSTLDTSSTKNEKTEIASADTKISLNSTATPPVLSTSREETTYADTTSTQPNGTGLFITRFNVSENMHLDKSTTESSESATLPRHLMTDKVTPSSSLVKTTTVPPSGTLLSINATNASKDSSTTSQSASKSTTTTPSLEKTRVAVQQNSVQTLSAKTTKEKDFNDDRTTHQSTPITGTRTDSPSTNFTLPSKTSHLVLPSVGEETVHTKSTTLSPISATVSMLSPVNSLAGATVSSHSGASVNSLTAATANVHVNLTVTPRTVKAVDSEETAKTTSALPRTISLFTTMNTEKTVVSKDVQAVSNTTGHDTQTVLSTPWAATLEATTYQGESTETQYRSAVDDGKTDILEVNTTSNATVYAVNATDATLSQNTSTTALATTSVPSKDVATEKTSPKKLKLTLPDWMTFPNKLREFQNGKFTLSTTPSTTTPTTITSTKKTTTPTTITTTTKTKKTTKLSSKSSTKTTTKKPRTIGPDKVNIPESILKAIEDKMSRVNQDTNQETVKTLDTSKFEDNKEDVEGIKETVVVEDTVNNRETIVKFKQAVRVRPTVPTLEMLLNASAAGPRVLVPDDGLYQPEFTYHGDQSNSSGSHLAARERHVSMYQQKLSVGTVFNRYWPAILGLTVGTVFLVVALLTSIACRQQRLFIQRRQWQQDTPQHLTEPPDTSEYSSSAVSSASSLASDHTRSSINFT